MAEGQGSSDTGVRKFFYFTKERVSSDWKDLAFHLGFEQADIDNIDGKNRDDKSRCMDLLEEWLKRNGNKATIEVLMEALSEANLQSTVDGLKNGYPELDTPPPSSHQQERKVDGGHLSEKKGANKEEDMSIENAFLGSIRKYYELRLTKFKPLIWNDNFALTLGDLFTELEFTSAKIKRLDDLFNSNTSETSTALRCILIEAEPGGGKTTFMTKEALDAVSKKTELGKRHDIVLLVRLREVREGETIEEMVWDQCVDETTEGVDVEVIKTVLQRNQSRVLFLLDGYDELRPEARADRQAIPKLLSGKVYPNSTIVITSRPAAGVQQYAQPDYRASIIGFTFRHVMKYVGQYFNLVGNPDLAKTLIAHLEDDRTLRDLVENPMFLTLVCVLWEEDQAIVSAGTMTGLYDNLLTCLIQKHCTREGVDMPTDGIPSDLADALLQLGKLALEALLRKETQLDLAEVERQNVNWELMLKLGVVFSEASASKLHPRKQLTFAHKTIQEFLAGRYVASVVLNQDIRDLLKITSMSNVLEHSNLLQFACGSSDSRAAQAVMEGLANLSSKEYEGLQVENITKLDWPWIPKPEVRNGYNTFARLCLGILNESMDPGVLQAVRRALPFMVSHNAINSREHAALKYYIQNIQPSSEFLIKMALEMGGPSQFVTAQVLQFLERTFPSPTPGLLLDLSMSDVFLGAPELTDRLVSILKHIPGLRRLDLSETYQFAPSLLPIIDAFSHMPMLEELDLSWMELGDAEIEVVQEGLKRLPHLAVLHFKANIYEQEITITAKGMSILAPSMRKLTGLKELDISCNAIGDKGMEHLVDVLPIFTAMQILILAQVGMSITGMRKLVRALRYLTGLLKLDISENHIEDIGLECLADILPGLIAIKVLKLSETGIGDKGMSALVKALPYLMELQVLDVSNNQIGDSEIVALVQTLCRSSTLDKEQNLLGDKSKALVGSHVQELDFSENTGVTAAGLERVSHIITLPALTTLKMSTYPETLTHLPDSSAMAVVEALPRLPALERLHLGYITMDLVGFKAVVQAAEEHPTLRELWYTEEGVPEGADTSASCLTWSKTLERYRWQKHPEWMDDPKAMFDIPEDAANMLKSSDFYIFGMNVFNPK